MEKPEALVPRLFEYLNLNCNYAVLRNYSGLPKNLYSRDIDILVLKNEFRKNKKQIVEIILKANFKIITYFKSDRMITFVCSSIIEGHINIVQFDFLFQSSIYGISIFDAKPLLDSRKFNGKVYHVTKEYEFLDKFLYLRFLNKEYPRKYHSLREEMEQSPSLSVLLMEIVEYRTIGEIEKVHSSVFKRKMIFSSLRKRPIKQIRMVIAFCWYYIKNMSTYKGFSIGLTGPDGSGKSTVIDLIIAELSKTYSDIQLFHFRPMVIPNLGEAANKVKLKIKVDQDYSNPHRGKKTGKLNSLIRLLYYSVDYIFGYFLKVRPFLQRRNLIIFDRYYTDVIADGHKSRIFLNRQFLYWFGKLLIPSIDYNILLTATKEVILERKQELDEAGIYRINENLIYLDDKKGYYLVLNEGSPSEAIQKILTIVFEEQHKKNMKLIMK